jgi:hypothetical protein
VVPQRPGLQSRRGRGPPLRSWPPGGTPSGLPQSPARVQECKRTGLGQALAKACELKGVTYSQDVDERLGLVAPLHQNLAVRLGDVRHLVLSKFNLLLSGWGELICLPSPRESVLAIASAHATAPFEKCPNTRRAPLENSLPSASSSTTAFLSSFPSSCADGTVWMHGAVAGGELRLTASGAPRPPAPLLALHPGRCQCVHRLPPPTIPTRVCCSRAHSGRVEGMRWSG